MPAVLRSSAATVCSRRSKTTHRRRCNYQPRARPPPNSDTRPVPRLPPSTSARPDGCSGRERQDLNDAADGIRAVQVAAAAAQHLDAIDRDLRQFVPVDPAAERVVQRHAVGEHERPARTGSAEPSKRDALRGRIRHARRRAAKQRESGHQLQRIIERHRSRSSAARTSERTVMVAVGSGRGTSVRDEVTLTASKKGAGCSVIRILRLPATPFRSPARIRRSDNDARVTGDIDREFEAAIARCPDFGVRRSRHFEPDGCIGNRRSRRIQDGAGDGWGLALRGKVQEKREKEGLHG